MVPIELKVCDLGFNACWGFGVAWQSANADDFYFHLATRYLT